MELDMLNIWGGLLGCFRGGNRQSRNRVVTVSRSFVQCCWAVCKYCQCCCLLLL